MARAVMSAQQATNQAEPQEAGDAHTKRSPDRIVADELASRYGKRIRPGYGGDQALLSCYVVIR